MNRKRIIFLTIIALIIVIIVSQYPKLHIATGYGAKCMASGVFVANRDPLDVKKQDLDYSIVKYTKSKIDYKKKSVTTSLFGLSKQTALFREGVGCTLIDTEDDGSVSMEPFEKPKVNHDALWRKPWPNGDKIKDTIFQELDTAKLYSAVYNAFDKKGGNKKRTAAVIVLFKGEIVAEKYWKKEGIKAETPLWGWSMNKSIINAITGILVREGVLKIEEPAPIRLWKNDNRKDITINNLLRMESGLKWDENYASVSDATKMLYRSNNTHLSSISTPLEKSPGTKWEYSSGTTNILSGIIRQKIGNDIEYLSLPYKELFNKIGMHNTTLETDAVGNFVGSSYAYSTARDWARFGLLYYNDGVWEGDTILPKGWVNYTSTPSESSKGKYGAHFWVNKSGSLPDVPEDTYTCRGHRGQRIFIIPSRSLVVVRLGFSETHFNHNNFLKEVLSSTD